MIIQKKRNQSYPKVQVFVSLEIDVTVSGTWTAAGTHLQNLHGVVGSSNRFGVKLIAGVLGCGHLVQDILLIILLYIAFEVSILLLFNLSLLAITIYHYLF